MTSPSKGLHQVQQATERHLEKVLQQQQPQGKVVVWASDTSNTSATMVADNRVVAVDPTAAPGTPQAKSEVSFRFVTW
jgi:ABC-type branched-subunit amino acid transport system substrate-binding protein